MTHDKDLEPQAIFEGFGSLWEKETLNQKTSSGDPNILTLFQLEMPHGNTLHFNDFFRFTHHWELRTSISRSTHQWGEWLEDSRSCDQPDPIRYWIVSEPFIENPGWFRNPQVGSLSSLFPVQLLEGECFVPPHSRVKAGNYRKVTVLECGSIGGTMSKL